MTLEMFDDLLGDAGEESDLPKHGREFSMKMNSVHELYRGVTIPWLCQAFTLPRNVVTRKLSGCPVLRLLKNGGKVYDFTMAASYLVVPRINVKDYIETLDPKDLPQTLRKEYWAAKLSEQRWRKEAGELWASEDVVAVFGEVFKLIKNKTRLWQNSIAAVESLSPEQTEMLQTLTEDLLDKIYQSLVALESGQSTPSQLAEAEENGEDEE